MAYSYQTVLAETRDRVLHLTLNRPEKLNAISNQLFNDLLAAVQEAEEDANVGVVVVKGAGRAFCAGYDITPDRGVPSSFDRGIRGDIARLERPGCVRPQDRRCRLVHHMFPDSPKPGGRATPAPTETERRRCAGLSGSS